MHKWRLRHTMRVQHRCAVLARSGVYLLICTCYKLQVVSTLCSRWLGACACCFVARGACMNAQLRRLASYSVPEQDAVWSNIALPCRARDVLQLVCVVLKLSTSRSVSSSSNLPANWLVWSLHEVSSEFPMCFGLLATCLKRHTHWFLCVSHRDYCRTCFPCSWSRWLASCRLNCCTPSSRRRRLQQNRYGLWCAVALKCKGLPARSGRSCWGIVSFVPRSPGCSVCTCSCLQLCMFGRTSRYMCAALVR